MPIVHGTFTYSWKKCIGLPWRLLVFIDASNELFLGCYERVTILISLWWGGKLNNELSAYCFFLCFNELNALLLFKYQYNSPPSVFWFVSRKSNIHALTHFRLMDLHLLWGVSLCRMWTCNIGNKSHFIDLHCICASKTIVSWIKQFLHCVQFARGSDNEL